MFLKHWHLFETCASLFYVPAVLFAVLLYEFYCLPRYQTMAEKYFGFEKGNIPNMKEIMKNISVSLVNSHYSLAYVKPDLPNVVNVAGIHFTRPKPLPAVSLQFLVSLKSPIICWMMNILTILFQHLQKFMDEAEHGVVYVSLGSILDTGSLHQLGLTLIHILKILPQRIIIKWDNKLSPHGSKNIFIGEWFSQPAILSKKILISISWLLELVELLHPWLFSSPLFEKLTCNSKNAHFQTCSNMFLVAKTFEVGFIFTWG